LATETTWILPMQARYVIGRDGIIVYADINADYRQHPDPCEIVPLLREMSRALAEQQIKGECRESRGRGNR
jgi:peroxiredoxin